MSCDSIDSERYPELTLEDDALFDVLTQELTKAVDPLGNPYSSDASYAAAIEPLPRGLRAMAATYHLDISLTLDHLGWHFRNFGEPRFVKETERGLRELGLSELAECFWEAFAIVHPLKAEIDECGDFDECLARHGRLAEIGALNAKAWALDDAGNEELHGSAIFNAWVLYARKHPENVFGPRARIPEPSRDP